MLLQAATGEQQAVNDEGACMDAAENLAQALR